ncbi:MAG: hypothetical protein AB7E52_07750 [Bdellovibrionales bacterium]
MHSNKILKERTAFIVGGALWARELLPYIEAFENVATETVGIHVYRDYMAVNSKSAVEECLASSPNDLLGVQERFARNPLFAQEMAQAAAQEGPINLVPLLKTITSRNAKAPETDTPVSAVVVLGRHFSPIDTMAADVLALKNRVREQGIRLFLFTMPNETGDLLSKNAHTYQQKLTQLRRIAEFRSVAKLFGGVTSHFDATTLRDLLVIAGVYAHDFSRHSVFGPEPLQRTYRSLEEIDWLAFEKVEKARGQIVETIRAAARGSGDFSPKEKMAINSLVTIGRFRRVCEKAYPLSLPATGEDVEPHPPTKWGSLLEWGRQVLRQG